MADFRQLALEFVLAEDEPKQTSLAKQAASEIQSGQASSNPVARWVESVQPWMPGSNDDDVVEGQDTPDWTSRAKALEFLSSTLHQLDPTVLKPSQVKLLVSFFGAMFDIDHKAGIMASATALSKIRQMKSFQPSSGNEIISKLCALKDDFSRQTSATRLAVYKLLQSLITSPDVAKDLQQRHGEAAGFMKDLLQLCSSERDPDCLLVWFDIQRHFLVEYPASQEVLEEVYNIFKAYFPITLPRIAQSNVTPEELKMSLRRCFSANQRLAHLTIPFLIGKMDQGATITVNVKIDILKTLQHCLESYDDKKASVAPYFKDIWGSLKYEVRNGEIEDTIWATLEVLKTLATRLDGDDLRDYTLTVTRDCVVDLSNITYTAPSGRLLIAVLSANPSAFLLMASPTITHLKENLRHPKTPDHNQDLLRILHVLLETRLLLSNVAMSAEQKKEFNSINDIFKNLYAEVLKTPVQAGSRSSSTEDELKISMRAVQAAGALVCQVKPIPTVSDASEKAPYPRLLEDSICLEICNDLFTIFTQTAWAPQKQRSTDDVLNETARALQRAIEVYSVGFERLRDQAISIIRHEWSNNGAAAVPAIRALGPLLAFVGCSKLSGDAGASLKEFEQLSIRLTTELVDAIKAGADPAARSAIAAAIESVFRYFNDACPASAADAAPFSFGDKGSWLKYIQSKLTALESLEEGNPSTATEVVEGVSDVATGGVRQQYLLAGLAIARSIYRHVTEVAPGSTCGIRVKDDFRSSDISAEYQFLHHVASLAGFIIHEMSEQQQVSLAVQDFALNIFQEEVTSVPADQRLTLSDADERWDWLITGDASVLSFSILEVLRPASIAALFERGIAQNILARASSQAAPRGSSVITPVLSVLSNKYVIENLPELMTLLEQNATAALKSAESGSDATAGLEKLNFIYAIVCGIIRRYSSKKAEGLLKFVRDGPSHSTFGAQLAQRMGMLVAPHPFLTKGNYAVVKPLWMQRVYFELVGPLLKLATDQNAEAATRKNYSVAVVLLLRHMSFSIYETDADQVVRITISTAQSFGSGIEALAALDVLQNILLESPEKGQDHLRSIINICVPAFTTQQTGGADTQKAAIGKLALEIVGGLPKMYEARRLVQFVPRLERELTLACGHGVRDLRRLARLARQAWAPLK